MKEQPEKTALCECWNRCAVRIAQAVFMQGGDRPIHRCGVFFFGFRLYFPCVKSVSVPAVFETFKCLQENGLRIFGAENGSR
jgi:hypothetical protein